MRQNIVLGSSLIIAAVTIMLASCNNDNKQRQYFSADSAVSATRQADGTWAIKGPDGKEPVVAYDSMRVVETGDQGHPKTVIYHCGDTCHQFQYYSNMQLFSEQHTVGTRKLGHWASYHPDGSLWSETAYDSLGRENGPYRTFRASGVPVVIGQYKDGRPAGRWEFYDHEGNLAGTKDY